MGFAGLEPEGLVFPPGKEVLWTVAYTGTLPVGTDTLCYWWDGKTNRWRDPVPGKVVDLGGGVKALQAKVTHFSAYGHALPGIAGQRPGGGQASVTTENAVKEAARRIVPAARSTWAPARSRKSTCLSRSAAVDCRWFWGCATAAATTRRR